MTLRPATPEDREFEVALHAATHGAALAHLDAALRAQLVQLQFDAQEQAYLAAHPEATRSIIVRDGVDVGRLWTDETLDLIHVVDIAVDPAVQRSGIASAVLACLVERSTATGTPIRLFVERTNQPAIGLYVTHGFVAESHDAVHACYTFSPG